VSSSRLWNSEYSEDASDIRVWFRSRLSPDNLNLLIVGHLCDSVKSSCAFIKSGVISYHKWRPGYGDDATARGRFLMAYCS
jgi:hypothetical protein